jgi:putative FmdB family regulatory protein
MPYYDYNCPDCGPFTDFAAMADFDKPCACPTCAAQSPRVLLRAPTFTSMDGTTRTAIATNERTQHAPSSPNSTVRAVPAVL